MSWRWIFEKGMFWFFALTLFIGIKLSEIEIGGVNKTIGWTHDQSNNWIFNGYIVLFSWLIFIFGYGLVMLMRKRTDLILSIFHFSIFSITIILGIISEQFGKGIMVLSLLSILVFALNFYKTMKNKRMEVSK